MGCDINQEMIQGIDTFSTLLMSVFNNKGVYALLLGSGISLPAKIMSGWKVTEDLVKKVAVVQGEDVPNNAFEWYKNRFGCDAAYSLILGQLGKKPAEMESLLRPYFEPSEEDKELGYKQPTVAHKAIAEMAGRGYFKVIITTNFDRLLESSLDEIGVEYQVICHESEISSRVPLYHHPLTILKINGDYKDCRFKNTEIELSNYSQELVEYLDAILKNFGLITCGWSATWDKALIKQIEFNAKHRYSFFFSYVGDKTNEINSIVTNCCGESLHIEDADSFFTEMNERLKALEMLDGRNKQIDSEVAVSRVKMYIADPIKMIQYTDLFENETSRLLDRVKGMVYGKEYPCATLFEKALIDNLGALDILLPMSIVAIRWAEKEHFAAIEDCLSRIANREIEHLVQFYENTLKLNHVLDTVFLYGAGVACVIYKKFGLLDKLFKIKIFDHNDYYSPYIIDQDNCWVVDRQTWNNSTTSSQLKTPFSTTVSNLLRPYFSMLQNEHAYHAAVCVFEKLLAMYYYLLIGKESAYGVWSPMGMFCWQPPYLERNGVSTYGDFFNSIERERQKSTVLQSGLFDGSIDKYQEALNAVNEMEKKAVISMI